MEQRIANSENEILYCFESCPRSIHVHAQAQAHIVCIFMEIVIDS